MKDLIEDFVRNYTGTKTENRKTIEDALIEQRVVEIILSKRAASK